MSKLCSDNTTIAMGTHYATPNDPVFRWFLLSPLFGLAMSPRKCSRNSVILEVMMM